MKKNKYRAIQKQQTDKQDKAANTIKQWIYFPNILKITGNNDTGSIFLRWFG